MKAVKNRCKPAVTFLIIEELKYNTERHNMGVYRICKWGVRNFMLYIFMGNNLSLQGVWGCSPKKI